MKAQPVFAEGTGHFSTRGLSQAEPGGWLFLNVDTMKLQLAGREGGRLQLVQKYVQGFLFAGSRGRSGAAPGGNTILITQKGQHSREESLAHLSALLDPFSWTVLGNEDIPGRT